MDPFSDKSIELGTLEYPYRSFKSVNFEVLNYFSHTDNDIIIYTKNSYIEDGYSKFLNLSSVSIMKHPELSSEEKPMLIPTSITQPSIMDKTLFHLLAPNKNNFESKYEQIMDFQIMNGKFSEFEQNLLSLERVSVMIARTSFTIKNINIFREEKTPNHDHLFLLPIFLQEKLLSVSKFMLYFFAFIKPLSILIYKNKNSKILTFPIIL